MPFISRNENCGSALRRLLQSDDPGQIAAFYLSSLTLAILLFRSELILPAVVFSIHGPILPLLAIPLSSLCVWNVLVALLVAL